MRFHKDLAKMRTLVSAMRNDCNTVLHNKVPTEAVSVAGSFDAPPADLRDGSGHQRWRGVLRANSVVQVFTQSVAFHWIQPYKTPAQGEASASGFFIDDLGHIITNAHAVDQAVDVAIQMPVLGKQRFHARVLAVNPEVDLALLCLREEDVETIKIALGHFPYLELGDSDTVYRADEIITFGYPLGQQALKSTTGVVSGPFDSGGRRLIQISSAINPGSSGGPSLDEDGKVIGLTVAGISSAQNAGYIIPINDVRFFLKRIPESQECYDGVQFLRRPFLGVVYVPSDKALTDFLGNPDPGGVRVVDLYENSLIAKAGLKRGDMIYQINGHDIDRFGEMSVPWSPEDRISLINYIVRLKQGDPVHVIVYRNGKRQELSFEYGPVELPPLRVYYPGYEDIDYEVFGGMVFMQLSANHLPILSKVVPALARFTDIKHQLESRVVITHIQPGSCAQKARSVGIGSLVDEVNGIKVQNLTDIRNAMGKSLKTGYVTINTDDHILLVFKLEHILGDEPRMSKIYRYPITPTMLNLIERYNEEGA